MEAFRGNNFQQEIYFHSALGSISFSQSLGLCPGYNLHGPSLSKKVFVFSVRRMLLTGTEEAYMLASHLGIYTYVTCGSLYWQDHPLPQ